MKLCVYICIHVCVYKERVGIYIYIKDVYKAKPEAIAEAGIPTGSGGGGGGAGVVFGPSTFWGGT